MTVKVPSPFASDYYNFSDFDLIPCPKCGSRNLRRHFSALPCNCVECEDCGHEGPLTYDSFGLAEELWNKQC